MISNGAIVCIAYDPATGKEIWRYIKGMDSTIAMPFSEGGRVFFYTGKVFPEEGDPYAELVAVNPGGKGDIAETHIAWRKEFPVLQLLTPVIKDGLIYTVDSESRLICLDAGTGESIYSND